MRSVARALMLVTLLALVAGCSSQGPSGTPTQAIEIIVDNQDAGFSVTAGEWGTVGPEDGNGCYGPDFRYIHSDDPFGAARFTPTITTSATYQVSIFWSAAENRTTRQPVIVHDASGVDQTYYVNLQQNGNRWHYLGDHAFTAGGGGYVEFTNATGGEAGYCNADAVRLYRPASG